jgi:hypothetical protein
MASAFRELVRVLKKGAPLTLVFQNTDPAVWAAIQQGIGDAGFDVLGAETLHKAQPSFKGVKAQEEGEQVAATDVVLLLRTGRTTKPSATSASGRDVIWRAIDAELKEVGSGSSRRRSIGHFPTHDITFESVEGLIREKGALDRVSTPEVSVDVAP